MIIDQLFKSENDISGDHVIMGKAGIIVDLV